MKERPILFSAGMVRALLAGTKTQTRRVVKHRKCPNTGCELACCEIAGERGEHLYRLCPYGAPGARLWVRETWAYGVHAMAAASVDAGPFVYAADGTTQGRLCDRWRPSIHMPRAASRITLEITEVRVEQLHTISRGDAMAEGCPFPNMADGDDPREWYRALWEQINGAGSWDANPWVWVVAFRRV